MVAVHVDGGAAGVAQGSGHECVSLAGSTIDGVQVTADRVRVSVRHERDAHCGNGTAAVAGYRSHSTQGERARS
jgi:hypothetical protein